MRLSAPRRSAAARRLGIVGATVSGMAEAKAVSRPMDDRRAGRKCRSIPLDHFEISASQLPAGDSGIGRRPRLATGIRRQPSRLTAERSQSSQLSG